MTITSPSPYSTRQYRDAFRRLGPQVSEGQRRMLAAHASAPGLELTDVQLAAAAGRDRPNYTWAQYGRLGHAIADEVGYDEEEFIWTRVIADDRRDPITKRVLWRLYPEVAAAVDAMGWRDGLVSPDPLSDALSATVALHGVPDTVREALVEARIGQGVFRQQLVSMWGGCAVSGCNLLEALRASHIKPWRNSTNAERLDPHNGLLLAANIDALFDAGLVAFANSGVAIWSRAVSLTHRRTLGLDRKMKLRRVTRAHVPYLKWHRENRFHA